MPTKVSKLTNANIEALKEIGAEDAGAQFGESYVVFPEELDHVLGWVTDEMSELPNRTAHPYASLHAVVRKLNAQVAADAAHATPSWQPSGDEPYRPEPGEQFQILRGYGRDDDLFRVIEYAPITAPPEKVQKLYSLPTLPREAVHCYRLEAEKLPNGKVMMHGVAFCTFPTDILVPVGSSRAVGVLADGTAPPRPVRGPRRSAAGACEHCGEPTKGGRFVPGHDAKLKGDLTRSAQQGDLEAMAEAMVRSADNSKWAVPMTPDEADAAAKLASEPGFLANRIAARSKEQVREQV